MPIQALPLGFALLPDEESCRAVTCLHQQLHARHPSRFVLRSQTPGLPHVSLFQGRYYAEDIQHLIRGLEVLKRDGRLRTLVSRTEGLTLWLEKIIFLNVEAAPQLTAWQHHIIGFADPLRRSSAGPADSQPLVNLSLDEQSSFDRYQYPFAGLAMRPHFTMGRLDAHKNDWPQTLQEASSGPHLPATVCFNRLVLFQVGEYGCLQEVCYEVAL